MKDGGLGLLSNILISQIQVSIGYGRKGALKYACHWPPVAQSSYGRSHAVPLSVGSPRPSTSQVPAQRNLGAQDQPLLGTPH